MSMIIDGTNGLTFNDSTTQTKGGLTGSTSQLCKAWVSYNGSGQAIRGSYNVSSVTYTASTVYTINFTTAFANANYCAVAMSSNGSTSAGNLPYIYSTSAGGQDPTTTTLRITTSVNNPLWVNVAVFS